MEASNNCQLAQARTSQRAEARMPEESLRISPRDPQAAHATTEVKGQTWPLERSCTDHIHTGGVPGGALSGPAMPPSSPGKDQGFRAVCPDRQGQGNVWHPAKPGDRNVKGLELLRCLWAAHRKQDAPLPGPEGSSGGEPRAVCQKLGPCKMTETKTFQ